MNFTLQNGYVKIPGHHGEFPRYQRQGVLPWNQGNTSRNGHISFEIGGSRVSIPREELMSKLQLSDEQIEIIREMPNISERSLTLRNFVAFKNAVDRGNKGNRLWLLFSSPSHENLRKNDPERFLAEVRQILDLGPISLSDLIKSFKQLGKEEFSQNFFELGHILLGKIFQEEDPNLQMNGLDEIIEMLESSRNLLRQDPRFSSIIQRIQEAREDLLTSLEGLAVREEAKATQRTWLRWMGTDLEIQHYLGLRDDWQTYGDQTEACKRIVTCFRNQSIKLDLSDLGLTALPPSLKKLPWIQELDVSKNLIRDLKPISHLKRLKSLDLSFNPIGGRNGITHLEDLNHLELLQSIKLLYMRGDSRILEDGLRTSLKDCDHIEWTDEWATHRIFSRRPGELLRNFLERREREFRRLPLPQTHLSREEIPVLDNPKDLQITTHHQIALERLGLERMDITPLIQKDPNLLSWLHRLGMEEGLKGFKKDPNVLAILSEKVPEILQYALENEEFFEKVLKHLLFQSSIACGDRTIYYFNEIVRKMELFQAKELPLAQALQVFRKYFPVALLKEAAQQSIQERIRGIPLEEKITLEKEALEVELDFLIRFQEEFRVPLALNKGTFTGTGKETRQSFLRATSQRIRASLESPQEWVQYLANDPDWRRYLLSNYPDLESSLKQKEEAFREKEIEKLEEETLSSAEYQNRYVELGKKDLKNSSEFLAKATEYILRKEGCLLF